MSLCILSILSDPRKCLTSKSFAPYTGLSDLEIKMGVLYVLFKGHDLKMGVLYLLELKMGVLYVFSRN